jgi:hypothetical protein
MGNAMGNNIPENIRRRIIEITEEFFGTADHPEQIPVTDEAWKKVEALSPDSSAYVLDEKGEPISWILIIPTTKEIAQKFLAKEISERELLDSTKPASTYDALYLCSAFTVSGHRREGLAAKLIKETLGKMPHAENAVLFAWPVTNEGEELLRKLSADLRTEILKRS